MFDSGQVSEYSAVMSAAVEEETFVRLLEEHAGIVRKVAAGYASSAADRSDLIQEITLQLWRAYPRYSPGRPFSTWMYRIALNVAISFLRYHTRPGRQTTPLGEMEIADESGTSAETTERVEILQQIIAGCRPLDRALLLLYLEDKSYREIASILGLTETNVATKLNRLKLQLRQQLTAHANN